MELAEIIVEIRKEAYKLNMEVAEYLEWVKAEIDKKLPWEEQKLPGNPKGKPGFFMYGKQTPTMFPNLFRGILHARAC